MYSSEFLGKNVLILGHMTEIHGPVQALVDYSKKNMGKLTSVLHPLPCSFVSNSEFRTFTRGKCERSLYKRNLKVTEFFSYVQHVFLTFLFVARSNEKYDLCVGIDNLNALCGIILRKIGIVDKVVFYVIDYTPKRFNNPILNLTYHFLDGICIRHSDLVWNISERMAKIREGQGVEKRRNLIVPVGVELEKVGHIQDIKLNRRALVFASHLAKSKGADLIIEAMEDVIKTVPDAKLEIIGTGPCEQELKDLVKTADLGNNVKFSGLMQHDKLMKYLPTRGVALATYVEDSHNITYFADPTKPKEYLACGLPVIITRVPWIAKEIEEKPMGIAINYDKKELTDAIIKLMKDDEFYERCRVNAKLFASKLSWDGIFDNAFYVSLER